MTNILFISPIDLDSQGGMQTSSKNMIVGLSDAGCKITIVLPAGSKWKSYRETKYYTLPASGFKLDPWYGFWFLWSNKKAIQKIISERGIDIIHIPHFDITASWVYLLKKWFAIPIVITVHGSLLNLPDYCKWKWSITEPARQILRVIPVILFEKKSIGLADKVIVVSESLSCIRKDSIVVPNAIECKLFNPNVIAVRSASARYLIICSGRISPEKGQDVLIKAVAWLPKELRDDIIVLLIGSDYPGLMQKLYRLADELNVQNIKYIPSLPYSLMPRYYKAADIIVVPSREESFGMVVLENLAMGNIIIASGVGGIPELIRDGYNGYLVEPDNPVQLAEKITDVLTSDAESMLAIRKHAIESSQKYSVESISKKIIEIYQNLLTSL
jgi:glycosyltransferase involved in cell wall biosynthesis